MWKKNFTKRHLALGVFIYFSLAGPLSSGEKFINFPVSFWYKQGFTLPESAEIVKMGSGDKEKFLSWLSLRREKQKKKIFAILKQNKVNLKPEKKEKAKNLSARTETNIEKSNVDFFFLAGSYQNLDTRYLPLEKRNHSSFQFGQKGENLQWILEKRDEKFSASVHTRFSYFQLYAGNRYKPLPNFYFAKDPDFFSNFDKKNSHLSQPILESYFAGFQFDKLKPNPSIGVYSSKSVSSEPGLYFVSPNQSYASTWAPYSKIGSLYVNDSFTNTLSSGWNSNLQGEALGRLNQYFGFVYLRSSKEEWKLSVDVTVFRENNQLLSLPTREIVDRSTVTQDLGFSRIRYDRYFALEGLRSLEGLRLESGVGANFPLLYGEWGGLILRYRYYEEGGFHTQSAIGRGVFYEYREGKKIFSLGGENRYLLWQGEGKISYPLNFGFLVEFSFLFRERNMVMRSWFENWSNATDFNINLIDRKEIWKLRLVGPELAMNISISQKVDSSTYIYYANFQFNHQF